MLVRSGELPSTMSRYLIQRLTENPEDRAALQHRDRRRSKATTHLERVTWQDKKTGEDSDARHPARVS